MSEHLAEDVFRTAAGTIDVPPAPYDAVVDRSREQRRHRRRLVAGVGAAVLVLVGAGAWVSTRSSGPDEPGPVRVVAVHNPVANPWYADSRLHLESVVAEIPDVVDAAEVGESVVYVDEDGRVAVVDARGTRTFVGSGGPDTGVLGSSENNWAAWLHHEETGDTSIVVWSVATDEVLATMDVSPDTRLVAIDQDRVYAEDERGAFSWQAGVPGTEAEPIGAQELAGVGSATRVYQRGHRIEMVQPFFNVSFVRPGEGAKVSPGGTWVLTREPGPWEPGSPYRPLLYDTRSGQRLPSGVAPDERVVDAAFGPHSDITYLVANVSDLQGADLDGDVGSLLVLRRCDLESRRCNDLLPVRTHGGRAMFAD